MAYRQNKTQAPDTSEPCWNCGGEDFTSSTSSHHLQKQLICAGCYEPQEDDESYYEAEERWW